MARKKVQKTPIDQVDQVDSLEENILPVSGDIESPDTIEDSSTDMTEDHSTQQYPEEPSPRGSDPVVTESEESEPPLPPVMELPMESPPESGSPGSPSPPPPPPSAPTPRRPYPTKPLVIVIDDTQDPSKLTGFKVKRVVPQGSNGSMIIGELGFATIKASSYPVLEKWIKDFVEKD